MKKQILIVDDEADIREVARLSIEMSKDWQVLDAASGRQGLEIAAREKPDVILLDVMMPDMDGPTTWKYLQENPATANISVIFLTAKVQPTERRRYAQLGVKAVLVKPFDPLQLADRIAEAMEW